MVMNTHAPGSAMGNGGPDRKILIAVDFGTTYSGLAWAQTRKPELQTPVIQWPDATSGGLEGITSDKVPTEIQYDGQNYKWGFQIGESEQRNQWFKLDLDPSQARNSSGLAASYPDPLASPPGYGMAAERLVKDYLTALRQHAEQVLRYKLPHGALTDTPIEYVITVPAVWSDLAQAKTRACAEKAGMGEGSALHIISEPEAAAMYALDVMDPHNIKVGDTFVLCDAGGGTVDLISYKVSELKPTLKISEANVGSGMLCGSTFLNRIFHKFLEHKLGKEQGWDEEVAEEALKRFEVVVRLKPVKKVSASADFFQIKRQYRGIVGENFLIPVPGLPDNGRLGIRRGRFSLAGSEVKNIFEPVVGEILKLILGQISATKSPVKAVLMVGGFGQNAYLRDRIRAEVAPLGVEVMQSPNGWTAVVRGALMKGLASTSPSYATVGIQGRCARKHYGIDSSETFVEDLHDKNRRSWSTYHGEWVISTMGWFVEKGDSVREETPLRLEYRHALRVSHGRPTVITIDILVCSDPNNSGAPMYEDADGVKLLVTVKADLSRIPIERIPQAFGADGNRYYLVNTTLEVTFYSAYTKYELIHGGVNYGPVAAEYV